MTDLQTIKIILEKHAENGLHTKHWTSLKYNVDRSRKSEIVLTLHKEHITLFFDDRENLVGIINDRKE